MKFPFLKEAVSNLFSKPSTVLFPAVPVDAQPNYRGRIAYDAEKCVNCGMCVKVCSPSAITRIYEDAEGGQNITYKFDLTSCTFCGTCQDFCSTKAITLTEDYHMVAEDARDLVTAGTRFKKAVTGKLAVSDACVYCTLCARNCPEGAITVDRAAKTWSVDHEKCVQCGMCISKCPKKALSFEEPKEEGVVFSDACVYCTLCAKKCPAGAITVDRASKTWEIDREKCIKCGACISGCPKKALSMGPIDSCADEKPGKAAEAKASEVPKASPAQPVKAEAPVSASEPQKAVSAPAAVISPVKDEKAVSEANKAVSGPAPAADGPQGVICSDACVFCTLCARNCPVGALTVDRAEKSWSIDRDACIECGACVGSCPRHALSFGPVKD